MRSLEDTRKRWRIVMPGDSFGTDLRQAVRDSDDPNPCQDGLRSVCWKAFLLYGPLSHSSWSKKLSDSRSAYSSLRDHFLKYIDHPDDLQSSIDPLADDDNSPWACLRQDEADRGEIFQDIERCMQDNFFFREPSTQKKLLDILFIYSKLNPDTGYRQGMHELLAPILWVVDCDAVDPTSPQDCANSEEIENEDLMIDILRPAFVEHDAFNLFCAVMQTSKAFYELGDAKMSPLVARSRRIQEELLAAVDPELEQHLVSIEILPQIYLVRWVRLLFGREFAFDEVLSLWDLLFAEGLTLALVDMTCVAMLLRIRWQLMDADYATALALLLHYRLPPSPHGTAALVKDAEHLDRNRSTQAGAVVIERYSGRSPRKLVGKQSSSAKRHSKAFAGHSRGPETSHPPTTAVTAPNRISASFLNQQRGLEALFQEVSGEVQRRAESWSIAKVVKGAVGEMKRNVQNLQPETGEPSMLKEPIAQPAGQPEVEVKDHHTLAQAMQGLQDRSEVLAKMLGTALEALRELKEGTVDEKTRAYDESFNIILAKLQFIQVYLADPEIPVPAEEPQDDGRPGKDVMKERLRTEAPQVTEKARFGTNSGNSTPLTKEEQEPVVPLQEAMGVQKTTLNPKGITAPRNDPHPIRQQRPSLAESSFSFMLGEGRHRSSFVSSASPPPEQRRGSDPKSKPKQPPTAEKRVDAKGTEDENDGFTMSSLRGFEKR